MIFRYLTLENQVDVMDNIDIVERHKGCMIRNVNHNPDGSLIYPEPLDLDQIELIAENTSEEKLLLSGIIANSFYYDDVRDRYLDLDMKVIEFYLDGTNKKNQFMYQVPGITSNLVPYKLEGEYCMVGIEFYSINTVTGNVIDVKDQNGNTLFPLSVTNTSYYSDYTINEIADTIDVSAYINNTGLDAPVIKVYVRKTYYPTGA
jgi:hypothetical protein